jgi:hypothetical protein
MAANSQNIVENVKSGNVDLIRNEKAKAPIWNHFKFKKEGGKIVPNVAVCDHCNESIKYSRGTTDCGNIVIT